MGYGRHIFFTALIAGLFSVSSWAGISVDRSVIEFEPDGEYYTDISVYNSDNKKAYVAVSVFEITNPGMPDESRQPLTDPDKALLLVTPTRLVLDPQQASPIRLLNLDEEQKQERIYRVLVEPVSGKLGGESDGVKLLIGYEMLVVIHPRKPRIEILAKRTGKSITFYNGGNTNLYLQTGEQCDPKQPKQCQEIAGIRLYAGNQWTTDLPYEAPVSFKINTGGEATITKVFDGKDILPAPAPAPAPVAPSATETNGK